MKADIPQSTVWTQAQQSLVYFSESITVKAEFSVTQFNFICIALFTMGMAYSIHLSIFPSIICTTYPLRVSGKLESIPADDVQQAGYTLGRSPVYDKASIHQLAGACATSPI